MISSTVVFLLLIAGTHACGKSKASPETQSATASRASGADQLKGAGNIGAGGGPPPPPESHDPLYDKAGINSGDLLGYGGNGCTADQTVNSYDELTCDFENSGVCAWNNGESDDFDWLQSTQPVDESKFEQFFKMPPPSNSYLITAGVGEDASKSAQLVACPVSCTSTDMLITLDHWRTENTQLQICKRAIGSDELTDCQDVPEDESPGPSLVQLPAGENFEVVAVASGLEDPTGSIVIIDNVAADFQPCEAPPSDCEALQCTFDGDDLCNFETATSEDSQLTQDGDVYFGTDVTGRFGPQSTGPREAAQGSNYAAARVLPGTYAAAESVVNTQQDQVLSFDYWECTDNVELRVCYDDFEDDANCPLITNPSVSVSDWAWQHAQILVPAGTQKVKIIGKNTGDNIGVVGIDDMQLLTLPPSGNPIDATDPACV